jgi:hypothetical protein
VANLRSTPKKSRLRPNRVKARHNENQLATGKKRHLRMPTVVRRLRVHLDEGNKIGAVKQTREDTGYSLSEALRLVHHCEGDHGLTDEELVSSWCGSCRSSLSACECATLASHEGVPTARELEKAPARESELPNQAQAFDCKCGDCQCQNEWHRLAVWLEQDPGRNYRELLHGSRRCGSTSTVSLPIPGSRARSRICYERTTEWKTFHRT